MEKMVGLFTIVVEGSIEFSPEVTLPYVKVRIKKAVDKRIHDLLETPLVEYGVEGEELWKFSCTNTDESGTIVRRLSDLIGE